MKIVKNWVLILLCFCFFFVSCKQGLKPESTHLEVQKGPVVLASFECLGPFGGRIDQITISPHDSRVILSASGEHVFITYDAGSSWKLVPIQTSRVHSLVFDRIDPMSMWIGDQDQLFVSNDFGKIWKKVSLHEKIQPPFFVFLFSEFEDSYLSTSSGLFLKKKNQADWKNIFPCQPGEAPMERLAVSQEKTPTIAGITGGADLFISRNQGETWKKIQAFSFGNKLLSDIQMEVDKFYVLYPGGLFSSSDKGISWEEITKQRILSPAYEFTISQNGVFYAATQKGVWQSLDKGTTWDRIAGIEDPVYCVKSSTNGQNIFAGTTKGLFVYSLAEQVWQPLSNGLSAFSLTQLSSHPLEKQLFSAKIADEQNLSFFLPSNEWTSIQSEYRFSYLFGDPANFNIWYGVIENTIWCSKDHFTTWAVYAQIPSDAPVSQIWINPLSGDWFAGTMAKELSPGNGIWKSQDQGIHWVACQNAATELSIHEICFDPVDAQLMYSIGSSLFDEKNVYQSINGGDHWTILSESIGAQCIACDRFNPGFIWMVLQDGNVILSKNKGNSWERIRDLSAHHEKTVFKYPTGFKLLAMDKDGELLLHLYRGVFLVSDDYGYSWKELEQIPDFSYYDMILDRTEPTTFFVASDLGMIAVTMHR